jgi:hypothetical protein
MRPRDRRKSTRSVAGARKRRIAAAKAEAARKAYAEAEERRKEQERARIAATALEADERATFVKRVQMVLKQGPCHDGAVSGRSVDAQDGLDRFVAAVGQRGNANVTRIELAKATAADFEAWLREASEVRGQVCAPDQRLPSRRPPRRPHGTMRRASDHRGVRQMPSPRGRPQAARRAAVELAEAGRSTTPHARTAPGAHGGRPPVGGTEFLG